MSSRQVKRTMYLTLRVTGIRQQSEEVQKLLRLVALAMRSLLTLKLAMTAWATPTPIGVSLSTLTAISLLQDVSAVR
jgi:hypothetical protein